MTVKRTRCRNCGHVWLHHQQDDEGCWAPGCVMAPNRCKVFDEESKEEAAAREQQNVRRHSRPRPGAPPSPGFEERAEAAAKLRIGTVRHDVYRAILFAGEKGMTDEELESVLCKKHQTVSAARNTLMNDDLIVDCGKRRPTASGVEAIVWVIHN